MYAYIASIMPALCVEINRCKYCFVNNFRDPSPGARPIPTEITVRQERAVRRQSTTEEILIARGFRRTSTTEEMIRCRNFRRQSSQSDDVCRLDIRSILE